MNIKEETEFFVRDRNTGRLHAQCKKCYSINRTTYAAEHYKKYGHLYRERARKRREIIKKDPRDKLAQYMTNRACVICEESDPRVLDFDHINPETKSFGISRAITTAVRWDLIIVEIEKCQILCANCHRKKPHHIKSGIKALDSRCFGGTDGICTHVDGFADRCLTARPPRLI